jgi:hypothetical protein
MNTDRVPADGTLGGPALRAWLKPTAASAPVAEAPAWLLQHEWLSAATEPLLVDMGLRVLDLGGVSCLAVVASAIAPRVVTWGDGECAVVFLLAPADPVVWSALDSWLQLGCVWAISGPGYMSGASVSPRDFEVLSKRYAQGEALESDLLAGAILTLMVERQLEVEVARQLGVRVPLLCAIVETPMICRSLQSVDEEEWRLHQDHLANRWDSEGIAS